MPPRGVFRNGALIEGLVNTIEIPSFFRNVIDDSRHVEQTERRELGYLRRGTCVFYTTSLVEATIFILEILNGTLSSYRIGFVDGAVLSTFDGHVSGVHVLAPSDGVVSFRITVEPQVEPDAIFNFLLLENGEEMLVESGERILV